ncbi:MAG: hypothetical protein WDN06_00610 [Asticcacaulis sp.]
MKLLILAAASVLALSGAAANAQDTGHAYGSIGVTGTDNHKTDSNLNGVDVRVGAKLTPALRP